MRPDLKPAVGKLFPFIDIVGWKPLDGADAGTKAEEKAVARELDSLLMESLKAEDIGLEDDPWKVNEPVLGPFIDIVVSLWPDCLITASDFMPLTLVLAYA